MPRRKTPFQKGERYHIYNRGNNSQRVFIVQENYLYFLDAISRFLVPDAVSFRALSLLPNHYHFSIQLLEEFDLSNAMKEALRRYVRGFNARHWRHGHAFEDRFKSVLIDTQEYEDYLTRYIHRNPTEAGLVAKPEDWPFSSYRCYQRGAEFAVSNLEQEKTSRRSRDWKLPVIDTESTLGRFASREDYERFVLADWERSPWKLENGVWRPER